MRSLVFLLLCVVSSSVWAWGDRGHRMVGEMATAQLSPATRAEVQRLLRQEPEPSLAGVSNWADEIRDTNPELGKQTGTWHYVNFSSGQCQFIAKKDCKKGRCIIGALERYSAVLKDKKRSDAERAEALKFLVHFIGDLYQPLHNSYRTDRGGNDFQVDFNGKGSNLHRVWDSDLIEFAEKQKPSGYIWSHYKQLKVAAAPLKPSYAQWSMQTCALIDSNTIYPSSRKIAAEYFNQHIATVDQQLNLAGTRLAAVLNYLLAP
jgi:nuclease S1